MKTRIELLDLEESKKRAAALGLNPQFAGLSVFRILLKHPELAKEIAGTLTALLFTKNVLDARLRELVIMRIGWVTGSVYEWTQHWRVARGLDIAEADLLAVRDWKNAKGLSAADRAVLAATDDTLQKGSISDATWAECCRHLATDEERIELVLAIGNWSLFSQLLKSLAVPLEDGVAAWPPDGKSP